jgi:hypothetical protein
MVTTCLALWGAILATFQEARRIYGKLVAKNRRKLHNFVLDAMGSSPRTLVPDIDGVRFDLASIDRKLQIFQRHQLLGTSPTDEEVDGAVLFAPLPERRDLQRKVKQQTKLGLPRINEIGRTQKVEKILDEMVEAGRLRRYPPRMWGIG